MNLRNGWTVDSAMAQIEKMNGWKRCADGDVCKYRNEQGRACAVGAFIPDGHEGTAGRYRVRALLENFPDLRPLMPLDDEDLDDLQALHDFDFGSNWNPAACRALLERCAREYAQ